MSTLGTRQNTIECFDCGDPIEDWCEMRRYGFWDDDKQGYERRPVEQHYCKDCWNDDFGRANGAHYFPETADELFELLDAADGDLAAILCWWSGRPAVRVRDGEPEAAVTKPHRGGFTDDGTPIISFESEAIEDFDREKFDEYVDPPEEMNLVRLLDADRTPFGALEADSDE